MRIHKYAAVIALNGTLTSCAAEPVQNAAAERIDVQPLTETNNGFAVDLYRQLAREHEGENIFFSPYSMLSALMMTAEGARNETAAEMGKTLCFPSDLRRASDADSLPWNIEALHKGMSALNAQLQSPSESEDAETRNEIAKLQAEMERIEKELHERPAPSESAYREQRRAQREAENRLNELFTQVDQYEIHVANALWVEKTYPLRPPFVEAIESFYETGGAFEVDFKSNPESALQRINAWVAEQTNRRIGSILTPGTLDELTRLVLTNAIYFKGEWSEPFEERNTRQRDFLLADGDTTKTPMMKAYALESGRYAAFEADGAFFDTPDELPSDPKKAAKIAKYPDENGFAMLELPYKGERLAMVLMAPNRPDGLPDLERNLTSSKLKRWITRLRPRRVHVKVPKFKLETSYGMKQMLQQMGMVRAFEDPRVAGGAQFGGMTTASDPNEQLWISAVLHKALVDVNEKGTEAAAITAVVGITAGMEPPVAFTPTFEADRPFLFIIQDRPTSTILFFGRMTKPASA
ncbi:MAG: serpin family protein [Candidatus Latescibacterota bacterium]|nr:MAG: serpin family protein [Candidatus Latescibacterota bacterium]